MSLHSILKMFYKKSLKRKFATIQQNLKMGKNFEKEEFDEENLENQIDKYNQIELDDQDGNIEEDFENNGKTVNSLSININYIYNVLHEDIPMLIKEKFDVEKQLQVQTSKNKKFENLLKAKKTDLKINSNIFLNNLQFGVLNLLDYVNNLLTKNFLSESEEKFLIDFKIYCESNFKKFSLEEKKQILGSLSKPSSWKYNFFFDSEVDAFFNYYIYGEINEETIYEIFELLPELKNIKTQNFNFTNKIKNVFLIYFEENFNEGKFNKLYDFFHEKNNLEVSLHLFYHLKHNFSKGKDLKVIYNKFKTQNDQITKMPLNELSLTSALILTNMDQDRENINFDYLCTYLQNITKNRQYFETFQLLSICSEYLFGLQLNYEISIFYKFFEEFIKEEIKIIDKLIKTPPENFLLLKFLEIRKLENFLLLSNMFLIIFQNFYSVENDLRRINNFFLTNKNFWSFLKIETELSPNFIVLTTVVNKLNLRGFDEIPIYEKNKLLNFNERQKITAFMKNQSDEFLQKRMQDLVFNNFLIETTEKDKLESIILMQKIQKINIEYFEKINNYLLNLEYDEIEFYLLQRILFCANPNIIKREVFYRILDYAVKFGVHRNRFIEKIKRYDLFDFNN